jgi:hypothetical protein
MRKNPVEVLTLINPSEEPWKVRPGDVALAVGVGAIALGLYYRRRQQQAQTPQPPLGDAMSQTPIWAKGLLLGGLAWFVFYLYMRKEDEREIEENLGDDELEENVRSDRYVVKVVGERVLYPRPDSKYYPGGYPLRSAQDFARIGSQTGKTRKVFRGGPRGKHVRTYREGQRVWPRTAAQAKTLLPRERPREFMN